MKNVILLSLLAISICASAQNRIKSSATGGNWSDTGSWEGGVVPSEIDTVEIPAGKTITIDNASDSTEAAQMEIYGLLKYAADAKAMVIYGDLLIQTGGILETNGTNTSKPLIINGNLVNDGTMRVSYILESLTTFGGITMGQSDKQTSISGSGTFGLFRQLTINNENGVKLEAPLKVSNKLVLYDGVFEVGSNLTVDHSGSGSGYAKSDNVRIERSQASSLSAAPTFGTIIYLSYIENPDKTPGSITEGYEIRTGRDFHGITMNNPEGANLLDDVTLKANSAVLTLTSGVLSIPEGKLITCTGTNFAGVVGTDISYVDGAVALSVTTTAVNRSFPVGKDGARRAVVLTGISSTTGTLVVSCEIQKNTTGTATETGKVLSPYKRSLKVVSGTLKNFSDITVNKGSDENNYEDEVLTASAVGGSYATLPTGQYSSLAYYTYAKDQGTLINQLSVSASGFTVCKAENGLVCKIVSEASAAAVLNIVDMYGRLLSSIPMDLQQGMNEKYVPLDVQPGTCYVAVMICNGKTEVRKFIVK